MLSADQLLLVLWKRKWTFLATLVLVIAGTVAVTAYTSKVYEASSYLLVTSARTAGSDFEATQTNQVLSKTYAELLQTRNTAEAVAERLPFPAQATDLQSAVEVQPITQSQLIRIRAEAGSAERAQTIANTYAETFVARVGSLDPAREESVRITLAEPAVLEPSPIRPRPKLYLALGILLGCFAAAGASLLRNRLDQRVEIGADTIDVLGIPVLGRIPRGARKGKDVDRHADAFRLVLANLTFTNLGVRPRTIAVVSASEGDGKTTCALNIARSAAEIGTRVLLVDGDLRRCGLTTMLRESLDGTETGFSNLLLSPDGIPWALTPDGETPLTVVGAGPTPPNPAALLGSPGLTEFEGAARDQFELVVYDTPPLLVGPDASLIATKTEGVVLIVDAARTRRTALTQAVDQLRRTQANILGMIVNRAGEVTSDYYGARNGRSTRRSLDAEVEVFAAPRRSKDV